MLKAPLERCSIILLNLKSSLFWTECQVDGVVEDAAGERVASIYGKWDDSLHYASMDGTEKLMECGLTHDASLLWKKNTIPVNVTRYNLTSFAFTLNEITPALQEKLPPTDSRFRPDQLYLENGEYEKANSEKQGLEKRQRMVFDHFFSNPTTTNFAFCIAFCEA